MPQRKNSAFVGWVGSKLSRLKDWRPPWGAKDPPAMPKDEYEQPAPLRSLTERLEARFEDMLQEVDELDSNQYSAEDWTEYGWIVLVRLLLPLIFFLGFGYEDGLFMTGFRYFSLEPFILMMYAIGYGLEGLRVAMVYSMNFSKNEGRRKVFRWQFVIWLVMSAGCGVAQLASALVIQALGGDRALTGSNALAEGAHAIMRSIPWLVYLSIAIRVALCAIADVACSGFLHKRKKTVEQKVSEITTKAGNLVTVIQAQISAQSMADNAKQFQEMISGQRVELQELRQQQKDVFDRVFQVGMKQVYHITEEAENLNE